MKLRRRSDPGKEPRRLGRRAFALLLGGTLVAGMLLGWGGVHAKQAVSEWAYAHGHHRYDKSTNFWGALFSIPGRLARSVEAPSLQLRVKPKHMRQLYAKRQEALAKGLLESAPEDLVPGDLWFDGKWLRVKLRLKGDYTDHLIGTKWSYRIQVEGDDHVLGMRRFSIQNPATKGYYGENLFFETLRHLGVVAPRYRFVRATINGQDLGVMALEEHFSKELLEHNGRRESVIIAFDETLMFHGLDDYRAVPIKAFRDAWIDRSADLRRGRETAFGLLQAFVDGTLPASQVFDVEELASFLACAELWGTWHPIRWHNMRFYLDPIAVRLAPVGFDANLQQRRPLGSVVLLEEPIVRRWLDDDAVFEAYRRALRDLCADVLEGRLVPRLQAVVDEVLPLLQTEFFLLEGFPFDELQARARFHLELPAGRLRPPRPRGPTTSASLPGRPLTGRPVPDSTVPEQLARHGFLELAEDGCTLRIRPGTWAVQGSLVVPRGCTLVAGSGTCLQFRAGEALVAHGPLRFLGSAASPVVLEAQPAEDGESGWQGIAVLEPGGESRWQHVQVRDTTGIDQPRWKLTGGVTFYGGRVVLSDTELKGSRAEDALNIVQAEFALHRIRIEDTVSDAFDGDFTKGLVEGSSFAGIGGDAVDVSGSEVEVRDCRFAGVTDKALSVGEGSRMVARRITVEECGTGAACKDGSTLELFDANVSSPRFAGLAAYTKKPVYGPARIRAEGLTCTGGAPVARVQTGSRIVIDGEEVPAEEIDVEALYETVMRKHAR